MKHTTQLTLALALLLTAHAEASRPVRVRELPATEAQAERVTVNSAYVSVELRPSEGLMTLKRVSPALPRPGIQASRSNLR